MSQCFISASILAADFSKLGEEVHQSIQAGIDYIHFDVMDHHYVPNLTFGAVVCESLRKAHIIAPIDVHLMVESPEVYIEPFAKAGANLITFHPETTSDVLSTLKQIRSSGMKAGLAFNPDNLVEIPDNLWELLDMILIMTVNPGFAGQSFKEQCIAKISQTRKMIAHFKPSILLGVDGGIKVDNIQKVAAAGADFFVVGSGLFHAPDYNQIVQSMRQEISRASDKIRCE